MIPEEFVRIIVKNSTTPGEIPTVPVDETDLDSFLDTDIFEGELFYNIPDEKLFTRSGSTILDLTNVSTTTIDSISTSTTVGLDDIYEITGGNAVVITLPATTNKKYTFKKMDSGGSVTFSENIDGNATFTLDSPNEVVTIINDGTEWIVLSYWDGIL